MLLVFTVSFFRKFISCLLLLVFLSGLIDNLLHSCQLKVLSMFVFDVETKVLDTETVSQHKSLT